MSFPLPERQPPEQPSQPTAAPFVYVSEPLLWEHKQLVRDLDREGVADEETLNRLGEEGWELAAAFVHRGSAYYLFKRITG